MAGGAIFHLAVTTVSRSKGRSAVAAAAYRAASQLVDARTGMRHDYSRKTGVSDSYLVTPDDTEWITDRATLWNAAEAAERRKNATVAREWLVALPDALDAEQRAELTRALAVELVTRYNIAVDVAIHAPSRKGDQRNYHAHLLTTTREATADGMGAKTRILDAAQTGGVEIAALRGWWAGMINDALEAAGKDARVDHRRKSVVVAEAKARAAEAITEADALEAASRTVQTFRDFLDGLKAVMKAPESLVVWDPTQRAAKRRAEAEGLLAGVKHLDGPPQRHRGPRWIAQERRKAAAARREQKARDAARRAAEEKRLRRLREDRNAERALPFVQRARRDPDFAPLITKWGIDLDRPDAQVARDPIWTKRVLGAVRKDAETADARASQMAEDQRQRDVEGFIAQQVERADTFPTPSRRWPYPRFEALKPENIQRAFRSSYRDTLTPDETDRTIVQMLKRWVARIVEDLGRLRPMPSIWTALTGGNTEAGQALRDGLQDRPELRAPLQPTLDAHDAEQVNNKPEPPGPEL